MADWESNDRYRFVYFNKRKTQKLSHFKSSMRLLEFWFQSLHDLHVQRTEASPALMTPTSQRSFKSYNCFGTNIYPSVWWSHISPRFSERSFMIPYRSIETLLSTSQLSVCGLTTEDKMWLYSFIRLKQRRGGREKRQQPSFSQWFHAQWQGAL